MSNPRAIPPKSAQFIKGESGNPNGRPKGARSLSTILREMLEEEIEENVDGKKERKQFQDVIVRKLLKKANDGDLRAIQEIFDRVEGRAQSKVDVTSNGETVGNLVMPELKCYTSAPKLGESEKEVDAKLNK